MSEALEVLLYGSPAGTLVRKSGGQLHFAYREDYRTAEASTPLSLSMPLDRGEFGHAVIQPWIQGLLPDNDLVLARWAREFHVAPTAFSLLGTPIGLECAGAVQFRPVKTDDGKLESGVEWLDDAGVAARIREIRRDQAAWTGSTSGGQFSLAGAQAKFALRLDGRRWGRPFGVEPTTHILKPAIDGFADHDVNEHLCLSAAAQAGLTTARTWVARFEDEAALVVERYDRVPLEGQLYRLHQEDFCQALGVSPARKYQNEGGPTATRVVELLRAVMVPREAAEAARAFVDGLIWNWLIGGTDAHAKNYSVLLVGANVRFAPLYDIASALPYGEHERKLRMAMKIGGSYDVYPSYNRWAKAAVELRLPVGEVTERVLDLARRAPEAFGNASSGVDALGSDMPARLTDLVADRCARCIRLIETTEPL